MPTDLYLHTLLNLAFGDCVALTESSAVVYANSVLGARSNQGYDFQDLAIAICGRAPSIGMLDEANRKATYVLDFSGIPNSVKSQEPFFHIFGQYLGREINEGVPALVGLPANITPLSMRAICASASTAGSIRMFHVPGVTPEARTLRDTCGSEMPPKVDISLSQLRPYRNALSPVGSDAGLNAVCLGAPHISIDEFAVMRGKIAGRKVHAGVKCSVSTSRTTIKELQTRGWFEEIENAGIIVVPDTCTYAALVDVGQDGVVMTNSGKWAYYGPMCYPVKVAMGTFEECIESAVQGRITRNEEFWSDDGW